MGNKALPCTNLTKYSCQVSPAVSEGRIKASFLRSSKPLSAPSFCFGQLVTDLTHVTFVFLAQRPWLHMDDIDDPIPHASPPLCASYAQEGFGRRSALAHSVLLKGGIYV